MPQVHDEEAFFTVSVIVHDDFSHVAQALAHLFRSTSRPFNVIVTINRGTPEQTQNFAQQFPTLSIVTNTEPKGFAANHNAVMRSAATPYVLLLNDDALLSSDALDVMTDYLEAHGDCGIVAPTVRNPDGSPQISAFSDPTLARMVFQVSGLSRFAKHGGLARRMLHSTGLARRFGIESLNVAQRTRVVPAVAGVCMLVRLSALQDAGYMDEDTRVYGEEFGWQLRMRQHGWTAALVAEAEVTHLNLAQDLSGWKLAEHRKGMLNYFIRYKPRWQAMVLRAALVIAHAMHAALWFPVSRPRSHAHAQAVKVGLTWHPEL
jgi:GT2 family glycosyltransferase